jgi:hypothetical protein
MPLAIGDRLLLRLRPALHLAFEGDRVCGGLIIVRPHEPDGTPLEGPGLGMLAGVVLLDTNSDVIAAVAADVKSPIRAKKKIDPIPVHALPHPASKFRARCPDLQQQPLTSS